MLEIANYTLPDKPDGSPGSLYPYQEEGILKALSSPDGFMFFNWATGTGKGTAASAGAQELFNRDLVDVVLVFTLRKMKINLTREFNKKTILKAVNIEGTKQKRKTAFAESDAQVFVMNYEKCNFDYEILESLIKGKRVLFVLDEVQKVLVFTGGKPNKAGQGLRRLIRTVKSPYIWPMSASIINSDPERIWRLFDLPQKKNELGRLFDFRHDYAEKIVRLRQRWGQQEIITWSEAKLEDLPERLKPWMHTVRKSDPGVREYFKDVQFIAIPIQLSDEDQKLYDLVLTAAENDDEDTFGEYYRALRYICDTPEALKYSDSELAKILVESFPDLSSKTSAKMEVFLDYVEKIKDEGEKAVVFCSFTNLGLFLVQKELEERKIKHVVHYGTGMTDKQAQAAQDAFKADPSITVFLSSDAGSHGLSFQEARYILNFDIPYSYDNLMQRNSRTDRVDSYLDGLTNVGFYAENTVQERIWKENQRRMRLSAAAQGTTEGLSRLSEEGENFRELMFG
jgi:hypothetical protein